MNWRDYIVTSTKAGREPKRLPHHPVIPNADTTPVDRPEGSSVSSPVQAEACSVSSVSAVSYPYNMTKKNSSSSMEESLQNSPPTDGLTKQTKPQASPDAPLQSGWRIAFRDGTGQLRGGFDEREHGTVASCEWDGVAWTVVLTDGQLVPLAAVLSVAQTDADGQTVAAWTVRRHGYNGQGG